MYLFIIYLLTVRRAGHLSGPLNHTEAPSSSSLHSSKVRPLTLPIHAHCVRWLYVPWGKIKPASGTQWMMLRGAVSIETWTTWVCLPDERWDFGRSWGLGASFEPNQPETLILEIIFKHSLQQIENQKGKPGSWMGRGYLWEETESRGKRLRDLKDPGPLRRFQQGNISFLTMADEFLISNSQ